MTHRVRMVFGRTASLFGALALMLALSAPMALAQQTTGKIEGTVTDQAGAPIANAQVLLVGTSFGALSNAQGYYFLNNVPVGTYTLRAQFIGYAPAEVRGVRVLGGQTITTPVTMQSSAVVLTGITVSAAANPIVPRDQVATKTIVSGELIDRLPVDDVRDVIGLQPGVVESGSSQGVSIRGGRPGEANVYIDGAPVRSANSGISERTVLGGGAFRPDLGTNAIEEASVTTGALGVEFSDAQSGMIAYTTRTGGDRIDGSFSYTTDEPFGKNTSLGHNRFEGSVGGPIPGIENLRFHFSGVLSGVQSNFNAISERAVGADVGAAETFGGSPRGFGVGQGENPTYVIGGLDTTVTVTGEDGSVTNVDIPRFVQYTGECGGTGSNATPVAQAIRDNYGVECQGGQFPMSWTSSTSFQGNLQYTYGSGSSVRLTGLASGIQGRGWPATYIGNPLLYRGRHDWNRYAVLNWFHQVTRTSEQALSLNLNLSWQRDNMIIGPLDPGYEVDSRHQPLGLEFGSIKFAGLNNFPVPIDEDIIRNIRNNQGLRVPLLDREDLRNTQPYRMNPYGFAGGGWYTTGFDQTAGVYQETRLTGRFIVDWQANRYHRFTAGGDASRSNVSLWASSLLRQAFMDAYVVDPVKYGVFLSDRLDLGDVVLEAGLRYDFFDANTLFPRVPGRIFSHPDWDTNDYEGSLAAVFHESAKHSTLAPRLRVSFPVTENTGFRLSYSHQVQTPDFTTLASGINNDLSFTNTNDAFGRDVGFGKSILFEFGFRHAFSQDMVLDISAYNKDKVGDLTYRILPFNDPLNPGDTLLVNVLTNADFGNVRGVDVKLDRRVGQYLNAAVAYTFQVSRSTGSDPYAYLRTTARQISQVTQSRVPPPQAIAPIDDNRTHNIVGSIALTFPGDYREGTTLGRALENFSAFFTFRVASGLRYTRLRNLGGGEIAPRTDYGLVATTIESQNASEMPWVKYLDLRLNKGFDIAGRALTVFADVRNLFNFKNVEHVFAETGDVVNEEYREAFLSGGVSDETFDVRDCRGLANPVNCVLRQRTESRFGDGDGMYTPTEQARAANAFYDAFYGSHWFYGDSRRIRVGLELNF